MTAEGTFPKIDGDVWYASDVNKAWRATEVFNNVQVGSLVSCSGVAATFTLDNPCSQFIFCNDGTDDLYVNVGSPGNITSGLLIATTDNIIVWSSGAQISTLTDTGSAVLKFIGLGY